MVNLSNLVVVSVAPYLVGKLALSLVMGNSDLDITCSEVDIAVLIWVCRESEGIFEYGNYQKEADDLHAVVQHFLQGSRVASVILGHSKGVLLVGFHDQYVKFYCYK